MKTDISIIIPVYNEAKRLPVFLRDIFAYCKGRREFSFEVIVVDDGSTDDTITQARLFSKEFNHFQIIEIKNNRGKGNAVKKGLFAANSEICLFMDADGSVKPQEIDSNLHYITQDGYDIFIGSRVLKQEGCVLKGLWYRKVLGSIFNFLVHLLLFKEIEDTQCGFKIFKKEVIRPLFSRTYLEGFGFDIEVLYLAHKMGYIIKEGAVSWHHVGGSKINLFLDSITMFLNIFQVRNWHYTPINVSSRYLGPDECRFMYNLGKYHWWFVSRQTLLLGLINRLNVSEPKILEIECGTGNNILELSKIGKTFGTDMSGKSLEFCKKIGIRNLVNSSAENLSFKDETFNIVICLDTLERVYEQQKTLSEIKRVLKKGGRAIITVPAFKSLWSQHDEASGNLRRYRKESLIHEIRQVGLGVEETNFFFFSSFFIVASLRTIRKIFFSDRPFLSDTTTLPPKPLNEFLKLLFQMEAKLAMHLRMPFGTTLYAVVNIGAQ